MKDTRMNRDGFSSSSPEIVEDALGNWKKIEQRSREWVVDNPLISLGIAATIGVTVGCLLKRK